MRIGMLGPLEVRADDGAVEFGGARLRALLALLALDPGRVVPVERLVDGLWEDRPPGAAANALQSLVSRLRAALDGRTGGRSGHHVIESLPGGYRLMIDGADVDAFDFEARVARARRAGDPARTGRELRDALALWRGPALADFSGAAFAEAPAARLEALRLAVVEEAAEAALALGRSADLIPELEALIAAEPLRERPHGQLMRALYTVGRQADALRVYSQIRDRLQEELGIDPGPELAGIHVAVLRGDPGLLPAPDPARASGPALAPVAPPSQAAQAAHAPSAALSPVVPAPVQVAAAPDGRAPAEPLRTNLRARLTSFIGREADLRQVSKMLAGTRLVTLTGPGGAGKTRLAVEAAEPLVGRMTDGVWFVDLSSVTDPAEVPHAVLGVLGLRETVMLTSPVGRVGGTEPGSAFDRLCGALAGRRLLLVLDNCEHLIDAAARLADRLLAECPGVRILTTSREPLAITGESLWPVESLPLPPEDADAESVMGYPAVRLLADRAQAVRPDFTVTDANVPALARICRALDGMPLAIELAAARLRALTPAQVAARLTDRFRLLAAGSRTALPRHQTLRAVVEWSWELLDEPERILWCRLAVFTGGATLESAEAVCAGPGLPARDVLDVLSALVDKSLVLVVADDRPGPEPRYRMLETIREYGLERLAETATEERARRAHAAYFLRLAERADSELRGAGQLHWLSRLTAEHENVHAALRWAIAAGEVTTALRMCTALAWYWMLRGHRAEGLDATLAMLALPGLPDDPAVGLAYGISVFNTFGTTEEFGEEVKERMRRALELLDRPHDELPHPLQRFLAPMFVIFASDYSESELRRFEPLMADRDPWVRAVAHVMYAHTEINRGTVEKAAERFQAALEGFRRIGDRWGTAFSLAGEAELLAWRGEHRAAVARYEEAVRLTTELGTVEDGPHIFMRLANELWLLGEHDRAYALLDTSLRAAERTGSVEAVAAVHYQLGEFARRAGDRAQARERLQRALDLTHGLQGPQQFRALALSSLALVEAAAGDLRTAFEHHVGAVLAAVSSSDAPVIATTVVGLADHMILEGVADRAAVLLGAAEGIRGSRDLSSPDPERLARRTREALGEQAFAAAFSQGRGMSVDALLAFLDLERPPPAFALG